MRHMRTISALLAAILFAGALGAQEGLKGYEIRYGQKRSVIVFGGENQWKAAVEGESYFLHVLFDSRVYEFYHGRKLISRGQLEDGVLKMKVGKATALEVRADDGRIRVNLKEHGEEDWTFKWREREVKVQQGRFSAGMVKYYPHNHRVRAKDTQGLTVAEMKGLDRPTCTLTPFLMGDVPIEKRVFLLLLFFYFEMGVDNSQPDDTWPWD